jgi:predicted alternative tryptophan synthase beta-subunit
MNTKKIVLPESEIPRQWYNIMAEVIDIPDEVLEKYLIW